MTLDIRIYTLNNKLVSNIFSNTLMQAVILVDSGWYNEGFMYNENDIVGFNNLFQSLLFVEGFQDNPYLKMQGVENDQ